MKIGFDVAQTCDQRAGCAWYSDSLIRALVPLGPEHEFFLYHQFGDWINLSTESGTHLVAPNVTETFTDVTPKEATRIWANPREVVIKTGAPDIVHATSFRAPRIPGARLVFTVYDVSFWAVPAFATEANRLVCQRGMLQALRHADGFIFISQSAHDEFERMLPGWLEENRRPWQVTPLAARQQFAVGPDSDRPPGSNPYWLAVGSLEPRKNFLTLLDALEAYWPHSAAPRPLWIAGGDGWKSRDLSRRIHELAAKGMVRRLGYVSDDDLVILYSQATALIFPSWYEGFGLPVLEAMALGCPVICSDRTSLIEVGGDAVDYFAPTDAQGLAQIMGRLESSPNLLIDRRLRGLAQAMRFGWGETARLTLEFYEIVMRSERRPAPFNL